MCDNGLWIKQFIYDINDPLPHGGDALSTYVCIMRSNTIMVLDYA